MVAAVAILAVGSWLVRSYPNAGYPAGYEAATTKGESWIRAEVDAAGGAATKVCDALHDDADRSISEPRYDADTFIRGCVDAIENLYR